MSAQWKEFEADAIVNEPVTALDMLTKLVDGVSKGEKPQWVDAQVNVKLATGEVVRVVVEPAPLTLWQRIKGQRRG